LEPTRDEEGEARGPIDIGRAKNAFTQDLETDEECGGTFVKAAAGPMSNGVGLARV